MDYVAPCCCLSKALDIKKGSIGYLLLLPFSSFIKLFYFDKFQFVNFLLYHFFNKDIDIKS